MKYLNFELSVDAREDGAFDVRSRSPGGDVRARMTLPFSPDELAAHREALEGAIELSRTARDIVQTSPAPTSAARLATAEAIGTVLFNALLTGRVLNAYRTSLGIAASQESGLRLQLRLQPPEIAALPWEFMYDPVDGSFVSLNPATPIVRYPEIDQALRPLAINPPLRILGMMAAPPDLPPLDKAGEARRIESSLAELRKKRQVELGWVEGGSYRDLQAALNRGPWHIFHFIGHGGFDGTAGDGGGILALEAVDEPGTHQVPAATIGRLLRGYPSLRLVVLNSCLGARASDADAFSSVAGTLVRRSIPAVVAMQYEISDQAALAFAQGFYASLAAGVPVDRAVADARADVNARREDSLEWGTPLLLMRSPDGVLFEPTAVRGGKEPDGDPRPPPPHRPIALQLVAGGVVIPLLLAGLLALWRMPEARIGLEAKVTGVELGLPQTFTVFSPLPVMRLGVSGLRAVSLSYPSGGRTLPTDAVLLSPIADSSEHGQVTLDLATPMPKGTRVWIELGDQPGDYVIKTDSLDGTTIPVTGPVQVIAPGQFNERVDFGSSGTAGLQARGRLLRIDLTPDSGSQSPLTDQVPVNRLILSRFDQYISRGHTDLRQVSTILAGTLRVEGAGDRRLAAKQQLRASALSGKIDSLQLAGDHLVLGLSARVRDLATGPDSAGQSLMPSALGWVLARQPWWVAGGFLLYLVLLTLVLRFRSGRPE
jgi:CHAT domain